MFFFYFRKILRTTTTTTTSCVQRVPGQRGAAFVFVTVVSKRRASDACNYYYYYYCTARALFTPATSPPSVLCNVRDNRNTIFFFINFKLKYTRTDVDRCRTTHVLRSFGRRGYTAVATAARRDLASAVTLRPSPRRRSFASRRRTCRSSRGTRRAPPVTNEQNGLVFRSYVMNFMVSFVRRRRIAYTHNKQLDWPHRANNIIVLLSTRSPGSLRISVKIHIYPVGNTVAQFRFYCSRAT